MLPRLEDLPITGKDLDQARDLMEEALVLKKMLDPLEEHSPAHRYQEVKQALAVLAASRTTSGGFRHNKIAFASIKRTSPGGLEYRVNSIEELPE
jgi:hypothetical protein